MAELFPVRLRVDIHTRAREIPWDDVLRPGRSLIYSWLYKTNQELAAEVHRGLTMAPFGYSYPTFPAAGHRPGVYTAGGNGWWEVGTYRADIAHAIATVLADRPLLNWGGVAITVTGLSAAPPPDHSAGTATWTTQTPVCLRKGRGDGNRTVLPDQPHHVALLRATARRRARESGIPIDGDPHARVLWAGAPRSFTVSGSDVVRLGAPLRVNLTAPPRLLDVLWAVGLGQQTGAGFGWIDSQVNQVRKGVLPAQRTEQLR